MASSGSQLVRPPWKDSFGILPGEYPTPLALVLTELATNALEHRLAGKTDGELVINYTRTADNLSGTVLGNGGGLPKAKWGGVRHPHCGNLRLGRTWGLFAMALP